METHKKLCIVKATGLNTQYVSPVAMVHLIKDVTVVSAYACMSSESYKRGTPDSSVGAILGG